MEEEKLYQEAHRHALDMKRRCLADALTREGLALHERLLPKDWSEEERQAVYEGDAVPYWERFGPAPDRMWFELYGSRDRKMDPRFIPSDLYYLELLPYMNNLLFRWALEDKNYLDRRFSDVKQAKTVCRRIAGEYYDENMELIREEDAIGLCRQREGELFLKPAIYSGFGNGIRKILPSERGESR